MSSIHTNAGATIALQTLRNIGSSLSETQQQIGSGLRVRSAADNAAYWSISTTMKSDGKAIATVSDTLGLSAAKVDVAYTGMKAAVDVLSEFKAKIVAATEPGVDKAKVQKELDQLKLQLSSIASSASFNGQNWLTTEISDIYDTALSNVSLVSSFVRNDAGVAIKTTDVDLAFVSLFNAAGGGALQVDERGLGMIGGLRNQVRDVTASLGWQRVDFVGPAEFAAADQISFDLTLDASVNSGGQTFPVTIDRALVDTVLGTSDGKVTNVGQWRAIVQAALTNASVPVSLNVAGGDLQFTTTESVGHVGSSVALSNWTGGASIGGMLGIDNVLMTNDGGYATTSFNFSAFRVHQEALFEFSYQVNGEPRRTVGIDRAMVDATLGTTDGKVTTAADMVTLLQAATAGTGVVWSSAGSTYSLSVEPRADREMGVRSFVRFDSVIDNFGYLPDFNILDVDIAAPGADLTNYLNGIEGMLKKVVNGAAILGSVKARVDLQSDFTKTLLQTISSGVGRLVDADMNEASTRLKAIQSQEQIAIQSLSIANTNAQNILSLFRQ